METKQAFQGSEAASSKNTADRTIMGDLDYNDLLYQAPENLTLRVHRTQRQMKADRTSYSPSDTCTIRFNTGSDYIDPKNSYLSFKLAVDAGAANFGIGSAINVIRSVVVRTKSGIEADRFRRVNLYKAHELRFSKSADWLKRQGSLLGYGSTDALLETNPTATGITPTAVKYLIPMAELCGIFNPVGAAKLMPAALASGLEVELTFESAALALKEGSATVASYTITDPQVHLEAVRLTDSTQRVLNQRAAKEGLSYVYYRYHTSEIDAASTSLTHRVALSVGQAIDALAIIVNGTAAVGTDNMSSVAHNVTDWYYRIGQLYYPATTLTDDAAGRESYFQALKCFDKLHLGHSEGSISQTDFIARHASLAMPFTKDSSLLMAGESVNNSRQLELQCMRSSSAASDQQVLYVKYLAQAKVFLDNVVIGV